MMKIDVNNITLNYTKAGKGDPLILLHGNGEDLHIFDPLIDKLKLNFTVYAVDSRNHGDSTKTKDWTYETMAEDIFQLIEKLELKRLSIVGFSDGAIIALLLAIKHRDLFYKMILLGVNLKPTDFKKHIYKSLVDEYEKTQDPLVRMMLEQPNIELEELKNIETPTLVVSAEDELFYRKGFKDMVKIMPNAKLKIMKNHDHGSYIINTDVLFDDLVEFIQ
ncbi:alpha/beta hydrolase family protein [Dysgonomonas alginatilytica]|uniref:Alpha/beta hydrolase family protein n=1 Tax=Dysgonomonas alginatilytica TaxID=1605892 RepID=A0A2V3PRI9_9BACT|nr:alpha/beta hydrolase [Dysgonomonas alginatilytica]PXV66806.1 alpha/beta hydrolase family protein [Dysgonomonas alginatilytica]